MRPAWWREFLQKVKMFFYGFKGFSNYRFTDREIETLLLRGYRKTRAMRGAKAEGGEMRFSIDGETKIFSLSELLQRFKDELSGTENRITVARNDYNVAVQSYNQSIKRFPSNIIAGMFGFDSAEYFEASEASKSVPTVSFS